MLTYKNLVISSLLLMLVSGFLHGYTNCFEQNFFTWASNLSGWLGSIVFGYNSPRFAAHNRWYFLVGGFGIVGFWVAGTFLFWLISCLV